MHRVARRVRHATNAIGWTASRVVGQRQGRTDGPRHPPTQTLVCATRSTLSLFFLPQAQLLDQLDEAMASLPPGLSFLYNSLQEWLSMLFNGRPPVADGCAADTFMSARHEDHPTNQRILEAAKKFCDAKEGGQALRQDSPCPESRSRQGTSELNTEFMSSAQPSVRRVILDSGAPDHVVGDISLLPSFKTITPAGSSDAAYQTRDGRLLAVAGAGTISLENFHLSDVLYVPDLRTAVILVSVSRLAERGYLVMFGGGQSHIKHKSSGKIVGKGRLHGDDALYHLEFLQIPSDTADITDSMAP
ncbi:unnamed protein product [Urochloa decumbens]|uniref:Retrovirus-related Pol polyprotein from transposon TNT 1-94-like beta-barrel domain-containing protein n=1 Tax=Urochloa decumbens TaxID=240449 RepID=A0ABC9B967_9POAL